MTYREHILHARKSGQIVRIYCGDREDGYVDGFVVATGLEFFALEIFSDTIHLNGFNCLRFQDVTRCDAPAPNHKFLRKVVTERKIERSALPDLDFSSLHALLTTAGRYFRVLTIHIEFDDDEEDYDEDLSNVCYIGEIAKLSETDVSLREITPSAEWENKLETYPIELVYRVDFGGGYEEALLLAANSN